MVPNKVKEMRLKKRLTQYALAKKVRTSPWRISRVERGLTEISKDEKIKIAKALETEVKRIFP
jgi:DNA-binding XRE family transcriptional regulator